jgi:hypothetical protein
MPRGLSQLGDGIEMAREHSFERNMFTVNDKLCRKLLCP